MFWYLVLIGLAYVSYRLVFRTYFLMLKMKAQLGERAIICFVPLLGDFVNWKKSLDKHGDASKVWIDRIRQNPKVEFVIANIFSAPMLYVYPPEYIKAILSEPDLYGKETPIKSLGLIDMGIVVAAGHEWKRQRTLMGSAFTYDKLKARIPMMNQLVLETLESTPLDHMTPFIQQIAGQVILKSFFGDSTDFNVNGVPVWKECVTLFDDIGKLVMENIYVFLKYKLLGPLAWKVFTISKERDILRRISALQLELEKTVVQKLKDKEQNSMENHKYFLDSYLDIYKTNNIPMQEIVQQFITLFIAGTETTTSVSSSCLYFLAKYQDIQEDIYQELQRVIKVDGVVTDVNCQELIILSAFIKEVLRYKNPQNIIMRQVLQNHNLKDIKLTKDWIVYPLNTVTSNNPEYYTEDPDQFNYKRWLNNNPLKNDNGYIYIPFSAGQRNCIGQHLATFEIKIILTHILLRYKITFNPNIRVTWPIKLLCQMNPDNPFVFTSR